MLFDVPFIPHGDYARFLSQRARRLHSVHFSLYSPRVLDARVRLEALQAETMADLLQAVPGPRKYLLINSRIQAPDSYFNQEVLGLVAADLEILLDRGVLDGLVYADQYWLQAFSDYRPDLCQRLEAVPSVNFMLRTYDQALALLNAIAATAFKSPDKLALDRSLNRDPDALADITTRCRRTFPGLKIELLANEGCLDHCPFKLTHDAAIAMVNLGLDEITSRLNRDFGCRRILGEQPHQLFKSPFIRPEDAGCYSGLADIIKICGRTLGPDFLKTTVDAYLNGNHQGNLLALMDTMDWLADHLHIPNQALPDNFWQTLTRCARDCHNCSYCRDLFDKSARFTGLELKDMRTASPGGAPRARS